MRFLSLFSGIGGFDLGLERAGMVCDSVCEIDKNCQTILDRHFPRAKLYDDVKKVGKKIHGQKTIDLICGGFPCQDLSVAGKRAGLAGERSGLWFEFARVIDELEPRWVIIENVPGLLSSNKGKDFAVIVQWLAERGYGVAWRVLDAQHFGIPQRRRRVFIIGSFGNGRAAQVLFESEGVSGNIAARKKTGKETAYSLRANPSHSGDKGDGGINTTMITQAIRTNVYNNSDPIMEVKNLICMPSGQGNVAPTLHTGLGHHGWSIGDQDINSLISHSLRAQSQLAHREDIDTIVFDWQSGGDVRLNISDKPMLQSNQVPAVWDASQETSKAHKTKLQNKTPYTLNQAGQMMVGVRRLTPVECARLQGFPDGWTEYSLKSGKSVIISAWLKTFAQFLNVDEKWLTENLESVSCTIKDSINTGQRICLSDTTQQTTNAKSVTGWLEKMEPEDYVQGITNHGSVMVTQDNQTGIWKSKPISKQDDRKYTGLSWKISLAENYEQENLSTILTWMKQMTRLKTSIFAKTETNMERYMILWSAPQFNCLEAGNLSLRTDDIEFQSDSTQYRQLGNAVAVPVVEWIGKRIMKYDK